MFGLGKKKVTLNPPCSGKVVGIDAVPDPIFADRMLGDGFAVEPDADQATIEFCAPTAGKLHKVFHTGHAFTLISTDGLELLVHIGLETVELKGKGFDVLAKDGDEVQAGTPIVRVAADEVRAAGYNLITPIVCTKPSQVDSVSVDASARAITDCACTVKLA
ncbi:PTS glucose transporter subunit IIA [Trueperella sp. LYQ143]|uniref:PTS sugar transporter subunit IIA n=1 Tax=Trueperella sp. LYQ143 TaxID=3391059 RepID=UPI0039838313